MFNTSGGYIMEFSIKKLYSDDILECSNHGEVDELFELTIPTGSKNSDSSTIIRLCGGCMGALQTITSNYIQLGMDDYSANEVKVIVPKESNYGF